MIGFLIVTHERVGKELKKALEVIAGKQMLLDYISFKQDDKIDFLRKEISQKIDALDKGEGVIIFTDLLGGSCTNISYEFKEIPEHKVKIVTGVNLNMLLDAVFERTGKSLYKLTNTIYQASKKATVVL